MTDPLNDLVAITDAAYQADLARLKSIAAEEAALRRDLVDLAETERRNAATDPGSIMALNQIGGDVMWRAWVGRKREILNLRLATVMARKLTAAEALRKSFGKTSVAGELHDRAKAKRGAARATRRLLEEQGQMVLKAGMTGR